jgi:hypothetical protein
MFELYNLAFRDYRTEILYGSNQEWDRILKACEEFGQRYSVELNISQEDCDAVIYNFLEWTKFNRNDGVEILEIELPFMVELFKDEELAVYYTGKIDRFTNTPNFGNIPRDYKKAGQRKEPEHLSNQFTGYCYATGSNIIAVDKVGFQKTLEPDKRFLSYYLHYNDFQKEQWKQDTIWWARQYAFYIQENTWPRNRTSCDKYSGCIYRPICDATDDEIRDRIIKTKYTVGDKWDPTKVLGKGKETYPDRILMKEYAAKYGFDLRIEL